MKFTKSFALAATSSLLLATAVQAENSVRVCEAAAGRTEYVGIDAQGKVVRLTIAGVTVPAFLRTSRPEDSTRYPQAHWTAKIGAGSAASFEH
jgi:hypothetical protein